MKIKIENFAAIDIGSNAIRLLICMVIEEKGKEPKFKKANLIRLPIRLGQDVFSKGRISKSNIERMTQSMRAFQLLMDVHGVKKYKACATGAMRESENGKKVAEQIYLETGVRIEIIDGTLEAQIISNNYLDHLLNDAENYLYVDVGGGSVEFTFYRKGKAAGCESFPMGTLRSIAGKVTEECRSQAKEWIQGWVKKNGSPELIGSGGNINKISKVIGKKGKPLTKEMVAEYQKILLSYDYEERITILEMNPDRADVIEPAIQIFLDVLEWSDASKLHVPKIGLADGIVKSLYYGRL